MPYIIGYYFNTYYNTITGTITIISIIIINYNFFLSIECIKFCFTVKSCSKVSLLPNRLSSYVFFFLVTKVSG